MTITLEKDADNDEIIRQITDALPLAIEQTREAAKYFKGKDVETTARNIYRYLRQDIKYKADIGKQIIKLPKALIREREGDCKSYALFSMAVCRNLGLKCAFRYTGYNEESKVPSHVYTVVFNGKQQIPIDGVLPIFGEDKGHFINDIEPDTMDVETITGRAPKGFPGTQKEWTVLKLNPTGKHRPTVLMAQIAILDKYGILEADGINGKFWNKVKKTVKKIGTAISDTAKKAVKVLAKLNPVFVVGRLAFLGLLKANYQGMASKMAEVWWKHPDKKREISKKWEGMGGSLGALEAAFNNGKSKGINGNGEYFDEYEELTIGAINGEDNLITKLIAKAAPIIETIAPFLKFINLKGAPKTENTVADVVKVALQQNQAAFNTTVDMIKRSVSDEGTPPGTLIVTAEDLKNLNKEGEPEGEKEGSTGAIVAVIAAVALLVMNKKN